MKEDKTAIQEKIKELLKSLESKNGLERKEAREQLVKHGRKAIRFMENEHKNENIIYRWEILKTLQQISDSSSIPIFIEALEDEESDIRWVAAEGLIKVGPESVEPLLKALIKNSESVFLSAGAHHVLNDLKKTNMLPVGFHADKLLSALKNPGWSGNVKTTAYELLDIL